MTTTRLCMLAACVALFAATAYAQSPPGTPAASPAATEKAGETGKPDTTGNPEGTGKPDATGASEAAAVPDPGPLAPLSWLAGCWQGTVNQREFREQWLPLRGGVLIGAGQSILRGRMQDYQYLRLEPKSDAVYFSQFSGDRKETSFKLSNTATDDLDTIFTFTNTGDAFPARLVYRRGTEGWLYETIEGTLNGAERKVVYPLRRVDCESGEFIRQ
jgi:hypothetical protein